MALGRVARGDQHALAAVYDATSAAVYGLALRILRDSGAAEDVTLEVYTQAFRQAATYDPERGSPLAWLLTVARSRAIDRLRADTRTRQRQAPLESVETMPAGTPDPEASSLVTEEQRAIREALASLTGDQRRVIELAYYGGLTHTEIAARLRQPLGTVKTRIRTGMLVLRAHLRPFMGDAT
jgi:RNA polymerase sigma-70 factor (ECF subfamily)